MCRLSSSFWLSKSFGWPYFIYFSRAVRPPERPADGLLCTTSNDWYSSLVMVFLAGFSEYSVPPSSHPDLSL